MQKFFSSLNNSSISKEDYVKAEEDWTAFRCKNMGDYTKIYCMRNVLLLGDIFENFRKINTEECDVDPVISGYTLPGVSWAYMLRYTKQEIELLTERKMYEDFEKGIRGGVSMCVVQHAKTNNKYMRDYDPEKPSSFLFYVDENNPYGNSMSKLIPYGFQRKMKKKNYPNGKIFTAG